MLEIAHMGGLTSCLSVILHEVSKYRATQGHWPEAIDASKSFITCKDRSDQNLAAQLLDQSYAPDMPYLHFDHGMQYADYYKLDLKALQRLAASYAWPSSRVGDMAFNISQARAGRTCVLYRGNDKATEVAPTPYDKMFEAAKNVGGPYIVLTDELEFFEAFADRFPNTIAVPGSKMIPRSTSRVVTGGNGFAVHFFASLYSFAGANKLITTTGNTGLWPVIWRGTSMNVWQVRP